MTWNRKLPKSLRLNDGRTITTLANARDMLLKLPQDDQAHSHWMSAGELLLQAAYRGRKTPIVDVGAELSRALQRHGLI
jgi:hypothetical protein